jgi:hypothetical protein
MSRIEVSMSETAELTTPLIKALNQTGGWAERMNSGIARKGRYTVHLHGKGTADILFFPLNIHTMSVCCPIPVWIETKLGKYGQTTDQKLFQLKVEVLGHKYIMVRSIAECFDALGL